MRADKTLGFEKKFFLEDAKAEKDNKKLPQSIHLVRRADYLLHLLHQNESSRNPEGSSSKSSKPGHRAGSNAPRPKVSTKASHDSGAAKSRKTSPKASSSKPAKAAKRKATPEDSESDDDKSEYDSMDDDACKEVLRPVKNDLKRLRKSTENMSREEKVKHLKETLSAIGARIEVLAGYEKGSSAKEKKRKHLCSSLLIFFPLSPSDLSFFRREMGELLLAY